MEESKNQLNRAEHHMKTQAETAAKDMENIAVMGGVTFILQRYGVKGGGGGKGPGAPKGE